MTSSSQTRGLIELDGHASDMQTLQSVAPACGCSIEPGPDQKLGWLYSPKFDDVATPQEAQQEATRILVLLNGLARLKNPKHRNADLGDVLFRDGQLQYFRPPQSRPRRETIWISQPPGVALPVIEVDARLARIAADPKLAEIAEVFGEEATWRTLRNAFEKIEALVGKGGLEGNGYATQQEIKRFKANAQDPRLSGVNAVHGVPKKELLRETKMTEGEGHDFVVRLLNTYIDRTKQKGPARDRPNRAGAEMTGGLLIGSSSPEKRWLIECYPGYKAGFEESGALAARRRLKRHGSFATKKASA